MRSALYPSTLKCKKGVNEVKELTELKNEFYEVMYKYEKSFSEEGVMANPDNLGRQRKRICFHCCGVIPIGTRMNRLSSSTVIRPSLFILIW